ncbi:MAG: ankyrin repeat domain-containing protein [Acidimicrobiales bacterium]
MLAASYGQDDVLDDLLDRGADVRATNDSGSTALHHAADAGNLHAIDRLLAAGADRNACNDIGLTPHMLAMAARAHTAALRLEAAGATPAHADDTRVSFRKHWSIPIGLGVVVLGWALFGVVLASPLTFPVRLIGAIIGGGVAALAMMPGRTLWIRAVPRHLEGPRLQLRTFLGRPVVVDLDAVTAAGYGTSGDLGGRVGSTKVVLVHPEGVPYRRRSLRRGALLGTKEAELLPEEGRATVMMLDSWWQHDVLRPVGNRLISGSAALTPLLQFSLELARTADPKKRLNVRRWRRRR